mmetsp:Transcript_63519/g.74388  ORF Transcript_63519/g.74388 Transcript_63519/m.74388 type:complete len:191 (+) Transcript_63519:34-606(+)
MKSCIAVLFQFIKSFSIQRLFPFFLSFQICQSFCHKKMSCFEPWSIPFEKYGVADSRDACLEGKHVFTLNNHQSLRSQYFWGTILRRTNLEMISSGLTFDDGEQLLISVQKPLGVILEEIPDEEDLGVVRCCVVDIDESGNAYKSGVRVGHWCLAVQNMDVKHSTIEEILQRIGNAPKVVNLRFSFIDAK